MRYTQALVDLFVWYTVHRPESTRCPTFVDAKIREVADTCLIASSWVHRGEFWGVLARYVHLCVSAYKVCVGRRWFSQWFGGVGVYTSNPRLSSVPTP